MEDSRREPLRGRRFVIGSGAALGTSKLSATKLTMVRKPAHARQTFVRFDRK
jgi:hypothetical protein